MNAFRRPRREEKKKKKNIETQQSFIRPPSWQSRDTGRKKEADESRSKAAVLNCRQEREARAGARSPSFRSRSRENSERAGSFDEGKIVERRGNERDGEPPLSSDVHLVNIFGRKTSR